MATDPSSMSNTNGVGSAGNASAFGASVAVVVIMIFHMRGVDFPAGGEAAIAGAITSVIVYLRAILTKLTGVNLP